MRRWTSDRAESGASYTQSLSSSTIQRRRVRPFLSLSCLTVLVLMRVWLLEAAAQKRRGKLVSAVGSDPYSPAPYVSAELAGTAMGCLPPQSDRPCGENR